METKGEWQKIRPQLTSTKIMHQNHIEFTSHSKLQLAKRMEKISICKTFVEQTSKQ